LGHPKLITEVELEHKGKIVMNIVITNHTGTRNRGCEALVLSKILGIRQELDDAKFDVLSHDPLYDSWRLRDYASVKYSYLTRTPEHTSNIYLNRLIYGLARYIEKFSPLSKRSDVTVTKSLIDADVIIPTGGDIFTSDYKNLRKHLSVILAAPKHKKIYLCGHTIGPFSEQDEAYFKKVISRVSLISVRERHSYEYLMSLNINVPVHLTADVAFTLPTLEKTNAAAYLRNKYGLETDSCNFVALSISQGIIKYSELDTKQYYREFAEFVNYLNSQGKTCLFIPHVMESNPDNNDVIACEEVYKRVQNPEQNRVIFGEASAIEFKGIIGLCDCLIGTRTHSTIASLSQLIPTVSVAYSRKAYGIMNDVFGEELGSKLTVPVNKMKSKNLILSYELAIHNPPLKKRIDEIKSLALKNFSLIHTLL